MSDAFSQLDGATVRRAARAAFEALLVVAIAAQAAAALFVAVVLAGKMLEDQVSMHGGLGVRVWTPRIAVAASALGALGAPFVAGWRVLGGARGGLRAVAVVLVAGAAFGGTFHSPILRERLRSFDVAVAAVLATLGAAATSGVAFTVIAGRPRPEHDVVSAPTPTPDAPPATDERP